MKCSCCGSEKLEEISFLSCDQQEENALIEVKTKVDANSLLTPYICVDCGHVELFSPILQQRALERIAEEEKRQAALSAEEKRHDKEQKKIKAKIAELKKQLQELDEELKEQKKFSQRDDITVREQKAALAQVEALSKQVQVTKFTIGKWNKKICDFDPNAFYEKLDELDSSENE